MDRNSVIGLILIGLLVIGYSLYMQPSPAEREAARKQYVQDSTMAAQKVLTDSMHKVETVQQPAVSSNPVLDDSLKTAHLQDSLSVFAAAAQGKEEFITVENDLMKVNFSTRGGKVHSVELKKYKTYLGKPVILGAGDSSVFELQLSVNTRVISTNELYFTPLVASVRKGNVEEKTVTMRLNAGADRYLEYVYSFGPQDYTVNCRLRMANMNTLLAENSSSIELDWRQHLTRYEKNINNERRASSVFYRFTDEEVDNLSYGRDGDESLKTKVKWVAFKQQFFTSVLIADDAFESPTQVHTQTSVNPEDIMHMSAALTIPYNHKSDEQFGMKFYFGPNHYQTLKKMNLGLEKQIQLGWSLFSWVNRFLVIPIFNFLDNFHINYGIIILILTIIVRILLLPLTYTSFLSQAKMRVLKPEIDEINAKYADEPMKKQQEQMAFYRKAGVNPLGGCIPGLLQLPILIAMFNFFPSSIELRQESFLWAKDLSTYDSIWDFGKVPIINSIYGDHVSLFTLLMTLSTFLFTKLNMQMTSAANPQMKWMMYIMPILFLGIFNNYSAGLSYYYFLSNMFGLGQQYLFLSFVDEEKIHRKLQENKKRPQTKSNFQKRLEKMAKERGYKPR